MSSNQKIEDEVLKQLSLLAGDQRLNVWHLAILLAILLLGYKQGQQGTIKVSRSRIMAMSRINTLPTYHKYFRQLQDLGYISYKPSYHPDYRSEITLLKPALNS